MQRFGQRVRWLVGLPLAGVLVAAYVVPAGASATAPAPKYKFTVLAVLGTPAPGGGNFINDFEPSGLNNAGEAAFTADVDTGGEAVFIERGGAIVQLARSGIPAPGATTFGPGELGRLGLNDQGDVAVPFTLNGWDGNSNFQSGAWRYSHNSGVVSAAALPGQATPGGGTFAGLWFTTGLNDRGDMLIGALDSGSQIHPSPPGTNGMALSLLTVHKDGTISSVARPGDAAPGGKTFDDAWNGSINNEGDIAFSGHVVGDSCIVISPFACGDSLYLRGGNDGTIRSIAHQGDPAPGGGTFTIAFGGVVNDEREIVFAGDLTPSPGFGQTIGIFKYAGGPVQAVARPGDPMPGGDDFVTAADFVGSYGINGKGDIAFGAALNTDTTGDGFDDTGMYVLSHGSLRLVARTGTVIPGVGTINRLDQFTNSSPSLALFGAGGEINNRGQVLFGVTLNDGRGALLLATPAS